MAALTTQQKIYVIEHLACFETPTEVQAAIKQDLGIDVSTSQICAYDPHTISGQRLRQEMKDLFYAARERFTSNVAAIPIANQTYRLKKMQQILAASGRNAKLALETMKQAAEDLGGKYTNEQQLTGKNGGAIEVTVTSLSQAEQDLAEWRINQAASLPDLLKPPSE